jgi:molybdate-binding protein
VEDLFREVLLEDGERIRVSEPGALPGSRVSAARVRDRLVGYPLRGKGLYGEGFQSADGELGASGNTIRLFDPGKHIERTAVVLGCDPAFGLLGAHLTRHARDLRVLSRFASSLRATLALGAGDAHLAGTHLHNREGGESNLTLARRTLPGQEVAVVAFSDFEEGLMVARGNPLAIRSAADLGGSGARLVNREEGAALRGLLDDRLAASGVPQAAVTGYDTLVSSHEEGARAVAAGRADAALGLRAIAEAHGLDFVHMETVRCDLIVPCDLMDHPAVSAILDLLQTGPLRRDLASLPGYDSGSTGRLIGTLGADPA